MIKLRVSALFSMMKPYIASMVQDISDEVPVGTIVMFGLEAASIPSGWYICDGQVVGSITTPDLRGKFIYGASVDGDINGTGGESSHTHTLSGSVDTSTSHSHTATPSGALAGEASHTHTQGNTGSEASHTHGDGTLAAASANADVNISGTTGGESSHTHGFSAASGGPNATTGVAAGSGTNVGGSTHYHTTSGTTGAGSSHSHSFSGSDLAPHSHTVSGTTAAGSSHAHSNPTTDAGSSHTHGLGTLAVAVAGGSHTHTDTFAVDSKSTLPPYTKLYYIMKCE